LIFSSDIYFWLKACVINAVRQVMAASSVAKTREALGDKVIHSAVGTRFVFGAN
jgi:hypothetical protein